MPRIFVLYFLIAAEVGLTFPQTKYITREEKLQQLKTHKDITITEVEKDILKLEYPSGKVLYKNIADYQYPTKWQAESGIQHIAYSPTYDSTIIDLRTIDTTLYSGMYSYWLEVPLGNFRTLLVGDVNNNGRPELYGKVKDYTGPYSDIMAYEMNNQGKFLFAHKYDSTTVIARSIFDVNSDSIDELLIVKNFVDTAINWYVNSFTYYQKNTDSSLATTLSFVFQPRDTNSQQNDNFFGHWDDDGDADQIFIHPSPPELINI